MPNTTGLAWLDTTAVWAMAATTITAVLALLWRILMWVKRIARRIESTWEAWAGAPADPATGTPERPGVVPRITRLESRADRTETRVTSIEHHLKAS